MNTIVGFYFKNMENKLENQVEIAVKALNNSGVVAFPTETVFGLAVSYDDFSAYTKLNKVKERPEDKPYTLMLSDVKEINKYAYINQKVQRIIDTFMPGSITILVPSKDSVPSYVTHNSGVIGLRIPTNLEAQLLLKKLKKPILAPSCNKSGNKPALNSNEAKEIFKDEIDFVIDGDAKLEKASTIVDLTDEKPNILREGPISFEDILSVWNKQF